MSWRWHSGPARLGAALHGHGRAVGFALANAGVIALYTIIDGSGARIAGNAWSYIVWLFVLDAIPFTAYMLVTRGSSFAEALVQRRTRGLIGGGLSAAAYAISVWAMTKAPVALVASLRETSVLFATLIGARLLKEHLTPRRWAGVGAVIAGVSRTQTGVATPLQPSRLRLSRQFLLLQPAILAAASRWTSVGILCSSPTLVRSQHIS